MAQPTVFARVRKPVHTAFMKACAEERRPMTRQLEIVVEEWLAERERKRKLAAG